MEISKKTVMLRRSGEYYKIILFFLTGLIMWIGQPKEIRKLTFLVLALVTWDQID